MSAFVSARLIEIESLLTLQTSVSVMLLLLCDGRSLKMRRGNSGQGKRSAFVHLQSRLVGQ